MLANQPERLSLFLSTSSSCTGHSSCTRSMIFKYMRVNLPCTHVAKFYGLGWSWAWFMAAQTFAINFTLWSKPSPDHIVKFMAWQDDRMTGWPDDKMTRSGGQMTKSEARWQCDKMAVSWQDYLRTEYNMMLSLKFINVVCQFHDLNDPNDLNYPNDPNEQKVSKN